MQMQIEKIKGHQTEQLFKAVLELKDMDECYRFFDDLCTMSEIQSLGTTIRSSAFITFEKNI